MTGDLFVKTVDDSGVDGEEKTVFRRVDSISSIAVNGRGRLSVRFNGDSQIAYMSYLQLAELYTLSDVADWAKRNG